MSFSEFIHACDRNDNVRISHVICSSGDSILAEYVKPPYRMNTLRLFFSMTKTFASLAIGIAGDLGLLTIDDYIIKYFPKDLPQLPDKNLCRIKIRHLLTMSSGIHDNTYAGLYAQSNWIKAFLKQEFPHEPGTYYRYSTHSSHMLSAIITKVSSLSLEEFLNKYLFHPMGIYEAQWEQSPEHLTAGGMGLSLYPHSLVKISQLLLNKGVYHGKRLISQDYLESATRQQIVKQDDVNRPDNHFCGAGYGFQFHISRGGFYRLDGAFGQLCLICPSKNLSVTVFSENSKMEALLSLVYEYLLEEPFTCGEFDAGQEISGEAKNSTAEIPLRKYQLSQNGLDLESIEFIRKNGAYSLILCEKEHTNIIDFSFSGEKQGQIYFIKDLQKHRQEYVCIATFDQVLKLKVFLIETPYIVDYSFIFSGKEVLLEFSINVSFTLQNQTIRGFAMPDGLFSEGRSI